jgi:hypothetical protein
MFDFWVNVNELPVDMKHTESEAESKSLSAMRQVKSLYR